MKLVLICFLKLPGAVALHLTEERFSRDLKIIVWQQDFPLSFGAGLARRLVQALEIERHTLARYLEA